MESSPKRSSPSLHLPLKRRSIRDHFNWILPGSLPTVSLYVPVYCPAAVGVSTTCLQPSPDHRPAMSGGSVDCIKNIHSRPIPKVAIIVTVPFKRVLRSYQLEALGRYTKI